MTKKFLPLSSQYYNTEDPYGVKSYDAPEYYKDPPLSMETIDPRCFSETRDCRKHYEVIQAKEPHPVTVEDEIFNLYRKAKECRQMRQQVKCKCDTKDDYTACVRLQRTPSMLKLHAEVREKWLESRNDYLNRRIHDAVHKSPSLVEVDSPKISKSNIKPTTILPEYATLVPSKKLLALQRPRSGIFLNDRELPEIPDSFATYNPRELMEQWKKQNIRQFRVIKECGNLYIKDPLDKDSSEEELRMEKKQADDGIDCLFIRKMEILERNECINFEPCIFPIPNDLHKTFKFTAEMVFGDSAIKQLTPAERIKGQNRPIEIACIYTAYIQSFIKNPDIWNAKIINDVLQIGRKLQKKSATINFVSTDIDFNIIPEIEELSATLALKLHFVGPLCEEPNILKSLSLFFMKFNAAVFCSTNLFLLIWKRCRNSFYIFDPNGRGEHCQRDSKNGKCCLIATHPVEHVVHLILNYSNIADYNDDFQLYEIHLINFGLIPSPLPLQTRKPPSKRFAVVNKYFAIVPAATIGIPPPKGGNEPNASLMISFLVILYSKMEPSRYWGVQKIEDIIRYGLKYNRDFYITRHLEPKYVLNIGDLPNVIIIGTYRGTIIKKQFAQAGHVAACRSYRESQLTLSLREFFCCSGCTGILQVDSSSVAVWRDPFFYYCFDPFARGRCGEVLLGHRIRGVGGLQLHTTLDSLCRMIYRNALEMRKGSKFFLHGIEVESIGPFAPTPAALEIAKFGSLYIKYPLDCFTERHTNDQDINGAEDVPAEDEFFGSDLPACLSELSTRPCQRVCPEDEFSKYEKEQLRRKKRATALRKAYSIQSIPEELRIPEYDNVDIVDEILAQFICEIINIIFPNQVNKHSRLPPVVKAKNVLLKTDLKDLLHSKMLVELNLDHDNLHSVYHRDPPEEPLPTVAQEISQPSNFKAQPDGTYAIFSKSNLKNTYTRITQLTGILSAVAAAALSSKYIISTWSTDIVEHAITSSNTLAESYESGDEAVDAILSKNIPKVRIGSTLFKLEVDNLMKNTLPSPPLKAIVDQALLQNDRIFVIFKEFTTFIMRYMNCFYMFIGYPCDSIGFRNYNDGPACLLRFFDPEKMIRRIELSFTNQYGCKNLRYVVIGIKNYLLDGYVDYVVPLSPSKEREIIEETKEAECTEKKAAEDKLKFLDFEIKRERDRINQFMAARSKWVKEQKKKGRTVPPYLSDPDTEIDEVDFKVSTKPAKFKHKPGRKLKTDWQDKKEKTDDSSGEKPPFGYGFRREACLFKIQGNTSLDTREDENLLEKITPCYFASVLAILHAVSKPLNQWDGDRVDKCVSEAKNIAKRDEETYDYFERFIKNVTVDEYIFEVSTRLFDPVPYWTIAQKIEKTSLTRRYFLLKSNKGTFAVFKDEYYHLFDPYTSSPSDNKTDLTTIEEKKERAKLEKEKKAREKELKKELKRKEKSIKKEKKDKTDKADKADKKDKQEKKKNDSDPLCPDDIHSYPDNNQAAWILFPDVRAMLTYIHDVKSSSGICVAQLHLVEVISFKKVPPNSVSWLSAEKHICPTENIKDIVKKVDNVCLKPEEMHWLNIEPKLVLWSRLNPANADCKPRNHPTAKDSSFDIEISDLLWSLWGSLHPDSPVFKEGIRGKQYMACSVLSCCVASTIQMRDWDSQLLDKIIVFGTEYHVKSVKNNQMKFYEMHLEDLDIECEIEDLWFAVHVECVLLGQLYSNDRKILSMSTALKYFFRNNRFGVVQCNRRLVSFGQSTEGNYFMYDCQAKGHPLFAKDQGASYVLRCANLNVLLYCIVMTLNVPYYNVNFTIHKVEMNRGGEEE